MLISLISNLYILSPKKIPILSIFTDRFLRMSKKNTTPEKFDASQSSTLANDNKPTPELANTQSALWDNLFKASLAVVCLLMVGMSFSYGISGDEVDMNEYGKTILDYFLSFGSDKSVFRTSEEIVAAKIYNYNRDNVVQYYGGLFDLLCAIVNKVSPFEEYTTRHILNALVGFMGIYFAAKITNRILNKQAGVIAIWAMFLSPFFLGHAMNNPKDIPFASAYIMAIYFIIKLFDKMPAPSKKDYLWAILSIGATINVRVGGILLIPYLVVFTGILFITHTFFQKKSFPLMSYVKPVLITGILGYLAGSLLWPYGLQNPISNPLTALSEMSNFKVSIGQLFEGTKLPSTELPTSFLPLSFAYTNTFAVLAGLASMLVFLWSFRKNEHAAILYFVAFTAFFPLVYIIYTKANVYHAWRHILFIFPSVIVLVAFGWDRLIHFFEGKKIKLAGLAMLGFLLIEPIYFTASTFPNTITYHNQLAGGVKGAYGKFEVDYYYNSIKQCADWFKKNELPKINPKDTVRLYSNAAHILTHYFKDQKNVIVDYIRYPQRNQKIWDYTLFHIALIPEEDIKSKAWLPASTLFKSESQGQVLSAIIKRPSKEDAYGFEALSQNKPEEAIVHFENYLKADANNTSILNTLGNILMQMGKIDSASAYIERSYAADSSSMETKQMYGMLKLQKGDFGTAQIMFTQMIQANPQYPTAYFYLGLAQLGAGNAQQALTNFNTASQDPSLQQNCYKYMGDCYMKLGNQTEAAKLYQAAGMRP
jgi:tetratricopeptide (TPR) repeat protein